MTTRGINLLAKQDKELAQNATLKKFTKTILLGIIAYCFITAVIFSVYFLMTKNNNRIMTENLQAEALVNSLNKRESLQTAVKLRVNAITKLLSQPASLFNNLVKIEKVIPSETVVELANISSDKVSFKGKVSSLEQLGLFLLSIEKNKEDYSALTVGPISKEASGDYTFSFEGKF